MIIIIIIIPRRLSCLTSATPLPPVASGFIIAIDLAEGKKNEDSTFD